jgi:hypothetical protein
MYCWVRSEQRILISFDDAVICAAGWEAATTVGLSPAQLDLAELLALGQDLSNAAVELGVSVNTFAHSFGACLKRRKPHNQAALCRGF